jgi:hypothetical protein
VAVEGLRNEKKVFQSTTKPTKIVVEGGGLQPRPKVPVVVDGHFSSSDYRRSIEGFSKIGRPMTKLLRKNVPFIWDEKCEKSFQELKDKLTTTPVLAVPKP